MDDVDPVELDRATGEGMPEATVNVVVELDPEVKAALEEFNRTAPFGRNEKGQFVRNDATQVQLIQDLARAVILLASGNSGESIDVAYAVLSAADQADAGMRRVTKETEDE